MKHLNPESRGIDRFFELFSPNMYDAITVSDLRREGVVKPKSDSFYFYQAALVGLRNVQYVKRNGIHVLYDLTGSVEPKFHPLYSIDLVKGDKPKFREGRLKKVQLVYRPKNKEMFFFSVVE